MPKAPTASSPTDYLDQLTAAGRRPASDKIQFSTETHHGKSYFRLPLHHAMEFLLKKDYTDNWRSELNEQFCFWSYSQWQQALRAAGFHIVEHLSHPYASEWIIKNRFESKVQLLNPETLTPIPWPHTNMVLVAQK